jgi:hypothetical protein
LLYLYILFLLSLSLSLSLSRDPCMYLHLFWSSRFKKLNGCWCLCYCRSLSSITILSNHWSLSPPHPSYQIKVRFNYILWLSILTWSFQPTIIVKSPNLDANFNSQLLFNYILWLSILTRPFQPTIIVKSPTLDANSNFSHVVVGHIVTYDISNNIMNDVKQESPSNIDDLVLQEHY